MGLKHCVFQLSRTDDLLIWSWNERDGQISIESAYDTIIFYLLDVQQKWWFFSFWKWQIPLQTKHFCWLFKNKILTWDNCIKRGGTSPIICVLCHLDVESMDHLMIQCPFNQ